eukprot:SAG31_NODE_602_length_13638_cov_32.936037_11_plen_131_part_00
MRASVTVSRIYAVAEIANAASVPLVVDAAAERPDAPNFYLTRGAAIVCYSGGKVLRGPQSTGLALGSREILKAAIANQGSLSHHVCVKSVYQLNPVSCSSQQWFWSADESGQGRNHGCTGRSRTVGQEGP